MNYENDINKILEKEKLISEEKINLLDEYLVNVTSAINAAKHSLIKEKMYCPLCDTYYRKDSFIKEYPKYICPKDHMFIDDYGC